MTTTSCPASHPFAYFDGKYCCETGFENYNSADGVACDGGQISLSSRCCRDNKHKRCPEDGSNCRDHNKEGKKCFKRQVKHISFSIAE